MTWAVQLVQTGRYVNLLSPVDISNATTLSNPSTYKEAFTSMKKKTYIHQEWFGNNLQVWFKTGLKFSS